MGKNDYRQDDLQRRKVFKRKRAGVLLTQSEVDEIIAGRKKLRADMKATRTYSKKEFELTASSLGLYFDKNKLFGLLLWLLHGRALWALLGAAALFMTAMYGVSKVTELKGHFTINLTDDMFEEGFELSNTADFADPSSRLFGLPVEDAPSISVTDLPEDVHLIDGPHNGDEYFAHTFYLAKRGEGTVDYWYSLSINSESLNCSNAIWVLLFHNDKPTLYAKVNSETGEAECLPPREDNGRAYRADQIPFFTDLPADQYEVLRETQRGTYCRLIPYGFADETTIVSATVEGMEQDEVDKYTVVFWLEGDDPHCNNDLIGAHLGMQMDFELLD